MYKTLTIVGALFIMLSLPVYAHAADYQPLAEIQAAALDYSHAVLDSDAMDIEVSTRPLDRRLRLPRCSQALEATGRQDQQFRSGFRVTVSCQGERPWSIHVPVTVKRYQMVVVAGRPLARGEILNAADVRFERRELTAVSAGYLLELEAVLGKVVKRSMHLGQAVHVNYLAAPLLVRRGQSITLLARRANMEIRSQGESLMDGAAGERIRVKNSRSKRVVEGIVTSNNIVLVN